MPDLVTVFRTADPDAENEANQVIKMLAQAGISATLVDDDFRHVPEGAYEVRVVRADAARAEALVNARLAADDSGALDESHDLDMVAVFSSADGSTAGFEALEVKNVLEANGIEAMVVNDSPLASLGHEVRVAREHVSEAKRLIAEAIAAGPAAADEAELQSEEPGAKS